MITKVQYPVNTRNNVTFGNAVSKGFLKGKDVIKTAYPVNNKSGFWETLKNIFFEAFPSLDAQFRKQMANVKDFNKLI